MRRVRSFLLAVYMRSGMRRLMRPLLRRRVRVLLYHQMTPERLRAHLAYFKARYTLVSFGDLAEWYGGRRSLPDNALVISFDDGWRSNHALLPVIREAAAPVTIFLLSGLTGTRRRIWNYPVRERAPERNNALKRMPHAERLATLKREFDLSPETEFDTREILSWAEVSEMAAHVDFQSHGAFHPVLTTCDDATLKAELEDSRAALAERLKRPVDVIAYPYGRADRRVCQAAGEAGYALGRMANTPRLAARNDNPLAVPGINVADDATVRDLDATLAWAEVSTLLGRYRRLPDATEPR